MIKKGVGRGFESLLAYLEKFLTFQKKYDIIIINKKERKEIEKMAKGWKTIYTNTNTSTGNKSDFKAFDKAIRNTQHLSIDKLKEQGNELYKKKIANEDKLIAAVESGRATKPEQVERVNAIKEARAKAEKSKKKKKDNSGN